MLLKLWERSCLDHVSQIIVTVLHSRARGIKTLGGSLFSNRAVCSKKPITHWSRLPSRSLWLVDTMDTECVISIHMWSTPPRLSPFLAWTKFYINRIKGRGRAWERGYVKILIYILYFMNSFIRTRSKLGRCSLLSHLTSYHMYIQRWICRIS